MPDIATIDSTGTAVVHLTTPEAELGGVFAPVIAEVMDAVAAQGLQPTGPLFARYFKMEGGMFELEIGVPVGRTVQKAGRVEPGELPRGRVARTIHAGAYDGLRQAWKDFGEWVHAEGYRPRGAFWERYLAGPTSNRDPNSWRTELVIPIEG
jgi:effector-binding domain-containing protein